MVNTQALGGYGGRCSKRCRQSGQRPTLADCRSLFCGPFDPHRVRLEEPLDNVPIGVDEIIIKISSCKGSEIPRAIDEKLRIADAVVLFQLI